MHPISTTRQKPKTQNVKLIALRSAGCNHVDLEHIIKVRIQIPIKQVHVCAQAKSTHPPTDPPPTKNPNARRPQAKLTQLSVVHVPAYSPNAVAEHALALLMTLNRRTHKVYMGSEGGEGWSSFDFCLCAAFLVLYQPSYRAPCRCGSVDPRGIRTHCHMVDLAYPRIHVFLAGLQPRPGRQFLAGGDRAGVGPEGQNGGLGSPS